MNTYQGGGTSQEKKIPITRHFASLTLELWSRSCTIFQNSKTVSTCDHKKKRQSVSVLK